MARASRKSNIVTKVCTKTGKAFPATPEFFYRDKSQKDGLSPWSKEAERAYNRAYVAGLKKAKVARKRDADAKGVKAFEGTMKTERVKRGTFTNRKKA
jgi:hypothetical protein